MGYGDCTVLGDPGRFLCVTVGVVGGSVITYACRVGVRGAMALTPTEVSLLHTINARKHFLEFRNAAAAFIQVSLSSYELSRWFFSWNGGDITQLGRLRHVL